MMQKPIDLLDLTPEVDIEVLLSQIIRQEPLISENRRPALRQLVERLISKMAETQHHSFTLFKVWDTYTGEDLYTLEGHKNVVYAIAFNNPYGDKIVTGSFDKTCKLWDAYTGQLYYTLKGHQTEIVCLSFNPQSTIIATGSMDNTAKCL
ncbi:hypothetical protein FOA52_013132 [Chlamydomonas sp. UWO 241]|nr:hypothetical protein FOA52_013132 [Chlamydomonas sp. UWO 241]